MAEEEVVTLEDARQRLPTASRVPLVSLGWLVRASRDATTSSRAPLSLCSSSVRARPRRAFTPLLCSARSGAHGVESGCHVDLAGAGTTAQTCVHALPRRIPYRHIYTKSKYIEAPSKSIWWQLIWFSIIAARINLRASTTVIYLISYFDVDIEK
jgi:hypothetical protein